MIAFVLGAAAFVGCALGQSADAPDVAPAETEVAASQEAAPPAPVAVAQADPVPEAPADNPDSAPALEVTVRKHLASDPAEAINMKTFAVAQAMDRALVAPAASVYEHGVPKPARNGLRNFFRNLHEPVVFLNYLIQLKPGKAVETVGRFAINSTIGVAGLVDVAKKKPFNMPYRYNGFANSMAYYGVKSGPFFYLPFIGPTTLRDLVGRGMDAFASPVQAVVGPTSAYAATSTVVKSLDKRIENDGRIRTFRAENNQYATARDIYLRQREAEIAELHGRKLEIGSEEQEVAQR